MKLTRLLILAGIALSVVLVHPWAASVNDMSRMATIQAIVEQGTFAIDQTAFVETIDKVFINGRFYSDKPPFPSIFGAAIYTPLYHMGLTLSRGLNAAYYVITLLTMKVWFLAALWCFYNALTFTGIHEKQRLWATCALALGSLMFPWTSVFNNHGLAASFVAIAFYAILKAQNSNDVRAPIAVAGLFLSLATVCDIPTGAIYAAFSIMIVATPKHRRHTVLFLLPCIFTVVPYLFINYQISGSILPFQINKDFFNYPGSPWIGSRELSGVTYNEPGFILTYGLGTLFGYNGFVLYNPLLLIAIPLSVMEIYRRRPFWRESLAILAGASVIFLYYAAMTNNEGGWSFSIRWFVPLLPILLFFLYPYLDGMTRFRIATFATITAISVLIAIIGLVNPWSNKKLNEVALLSNLEILTNRTRLVSDRLFEMR